MNICEFLDRFPDERSCLDLLIGATLGVPPICPKCRRVSQMLGTEKCKRQACSRCGNSYDPTSLTFLRHSRLPLRTSLYALLMFVTSKSGSSAHFLSRHLGISHKAAWRLGDAMRRHLTALDLSDHVAFTAPGEIVCIDETLVTNLLDDSGTGRAQAIVFGIASAARTMAFVVPDRSARTLLPLIERFVGKEVRVVTDGFATYRCLARLGYSHAVVDHKKGYWKTKEGYSTAPIEVYWSLFKKFLRRTHIRIEARNLPLGHLEEPPNFGMISR